MGGVMAQYYSYLTERAQHARQGAPLAPRMSHGAYLSALLAGAILVVSEGICSAGARGGARGASSSVSLVERENFRGAY